LRADTVSGASKTDSFNKLRRKGFLLSVNTSLRRGLALPPPGCGFPYLGVELRSLTEKCAVKGAGLQRVQLPPGNWFAPPGRWDETRSIPITDGVKLPVINATYGAITISASTSFVSGCIGPRDFGRVRIAFPAGFI
jgi:hypothetical protein